MPTALPAFSAYGIELEYMLVDRDTLDIQPIADRLLASTTIADPLVDCSNELVNHVIEIKNPQPTDLSQLGAAFQKQVQQLNRQLADSNACLMPTAMHPWMDPTRETRLWPHDEQQIYVTFDGLFGCKRHPWANVQSMHINLPFANDQEFERLLSAIRVLLPILPAIAASSPIADNTPTGWMDYRMQVYPEQSPSQPRIVGDVIPEVAKSKSDYESRILSPIYADIEPLDPHHKLRFEWLNARGAIARFDRNAIEIRVMDVQECPAADIALAAWVIDVVHALYQTQFADLCAQQALTNTALRKILDQCNQHAEQAEITDRQYLALWGYQGEQTTAMALWQHLSERLLRHNAPHAPLWREHFALISTHGCLARRILQTMTEYPPAQALSSVYQRLTSHLQQGEFFIPKS